MNEFGERRMKQISKTTPTYDSDSPHWDDRMEFPSGGFIEFGGQGVTRWDYRITNVILSQYPRCHVDVSGRSLSPGKRHPDVLSVRIGALSTKLIPLSTESTTFVHIDFKGIIHVKRKKLVETDFRKRWSIATAKWIETPVTKVIADILQMADEPLGKMKDTEPSSACDSKLCGFRSHER
jgi:hypothetical protein